MERKVRFFGLAKLSHIAGRLGGCVCCLCVACCKTASRIDGLNCEYVLDISKLFPPISYEH